MTFGEKLKSLRMQKFYSQSDVAEICNTAIFTVSRWENNISFPTYKTIAKIAKAFNVKPSDLLEDGFSEKEKQEIQHANDYYERNNIEVHISKDHKYDGIISQLSPEGLRELDHFIENMLLTNPRYRK